MHPVIENGAKSNYRLVDALVVASSGSMNRRRVGKHLIVAILIPLIIRFSWKYLFALFVMFWGPD